MSKNNFVKCLAVVCLVIVVAVLAINENEIAQGIAQAFRL